MPGRLIAIEGIDGSGKGTQAKRLYERFLAAGQRAALLSFPRYSETRFGHFVGDYLNGRFGALESVHPFLASLLFAGDRFESRPMLLEALAANDVVICDRYIASNIAHQGARVAAQERGQLIEQIETVEYDVFKLPRPDLTILLDLSVENAKRLISQKSARSYTDRAEDLHEADVDYLAVVRSVYQTLARRSGDWRLIACDAAGEIRPIDDLANDIWSLARS
jgi:dTMP kinase